MGLEILVNQSKICETLDCSWRPNKTPELYQNENYLFPTDNCNYIPVIPFSTLVLEFSNWDGN